MGLRGSNDVTFNFFIYISESVRWHRPNATKSTRVAMRTGSTQSDCCWWWRPFKSCSNGMSVLEALLDMRQTLPPDHPIYKAVVEALADDLNLVPGVDYENDEQVWEIALGTTNLGSSGTYLQMRRFFSIVFALEKLDREWHTKRTVIRWILPHLETGRELPACASSFVAPADLYSHHFLPVLSHVRRARRATVSDTVCSVGTRLEA